MLFSSRVHPEVSFRMGKEVNPAFAWSNFIVFTCNCWCTSCLLLWWEQCLK